MLFTILSNFDFILSRCAPLLIAMTFLLLSIPKTAMLGKILPFDNNINLSLSLLKNFFD